MQIKRETSPQAKKYEPIWKKMYFLKIPASHIFAELSSLLYCAAIIPF